MARQSMGYPLPAGDAYTSDLACMMLMYPDKPEYRQALFGALDYFGTWLAWEKETNKKGKDAARAWREAIEATRECIEMNSCETIIELLTDIRTNTGIYCCAPGDISDGDQYTDEVDDGVGNVPQNVIDAGYATGVSDWPGFYDYKCMISHLMVENMIAQVEKIDSYMLASGAILGGIPSLAAVVAVIFTGALSVLVYSIALGVSVPFALYAAVALLGKSGISDLLDDLATHEDALVCAIYNADGSDAAVAALRAKIDELFSVGKADVLNNLNIDAQLKALYSGRYDQQDVALILSDLGYDVTDYTCSCPVDYGEWQSPEENCDANVLLFTVNNGWTMSTPHGNPTGNDLYGWRKPSSNPVGSANASVIAVRGATGLTTNTGKDMTINRFSFDMYRSVSGAADIKLTIGADVTTYSLAVATWTRVEYVPTTPIYRARAAECFKIEIVQPGSTGYVHFDNVVVDFDGPP